MYVPTKATVKLANGKTRHDQGIGTILCCFDHCFFINQTVPVYYCPCYLSNKISSGALKSYAVFQKIKSESLEYCDFVDPQGCSWISP